MMYISRFLLELYFQEYLRYPSYHFTKSHICHEHFSLCPSVLNRINTLVNMALPVVCRTEVLVHVITVLNLLLYGNR